MNKEKEPLLVVKDLKQYFKTCLPYALVAALVLEMVAYFMFV